MPPSELLGALQVELDTHFSLEECVARLENVQEFRHMSPSSVRVVIMTADANGVDFTMNLSALRGVKCWFVGEIEFAREGSNLVTGRVGLSPDLLWVTLGLLLLPGFALIDRSIVLLTVLGLLALSMGIVCWLVAMRSRYWLIDILEEIF